MIIEAAAIASSYSTRPTLRQVFYRLVAGGTIPNTQTMYKSLSSRTAKARRAGWFPSLSDGTRRIEKPLLFDDPADGISTLIGWYRLDRTRDQDSQVWVVLEKATLSTLATEATDRFGVPVVALRGYGSQTIIDAMSQQISRDGRDAELIYLGDHDPTGDDIDRDLIDRLTVRVNLTRLAVTPSQITSMGLPPMPGKATDSRAAKFLAKHGALVQVEVEAIDPGTLETMIHDAVESLTDLSTLAEVQSAEADDVAELEQIAEAL